MSVLYWNSMCGNSSPFWDYQVVWNTTQPDFPACFQKTILGWVPCIVLWIFVPLEITAINRSRFKCIPWTILNITKLVICLLLFVVNLINLMSNTTFSHRQDAHLAEFITTVVQGTTMVLSGYLMWQQRKSGIVSSAPLLTFWFLEVLSSATIFRSQILKMSDQASSIEADEYVYQAICFPLILAQFILMLLADAEPLDCVSSTKQALSPEEVSSSLSKAFFIWYDGLALMGYRMSLKVKDLYPLKHEMQCNVVLNKFYKVLNNVLYPTSAITAKQVPNENAAEDVALRTAHTLPEGKPFLFKSLMRAFGLQFLFVIVLRILGDGFAFLGPLVLNQVIAFTSSGAPVWQGLTFAVLLGLTSFMEAMFLVHSTRVCSELSLKLRSALMSFVYRKTLKLSIKARSKTTVGQIVNHMAIDVQKVVTCVDISVLAITVPFQVVIAMAELWMILGPSSLFTLVMVAVVQGITMILVRKAHRLQVEFMKLKDKRVKLMNEVLNGIKLLKLFAWELPFKDYIDEFRQRELRVLRALFYIMATMSIFWGSSTIIISCGVFAMYVLVSPNNIFDASTAFVSLTIFNLIRRPLMMLPNLISAVVEANVAMGRLNVFSWNDEIDPDGIQSITDGKTAVLVEDANFSWGDENSPCLTNINLDIKDGSLVAIVGQVGAGKSSLISALLGEMIKLQGKVACRDSVAYSAQLPWIQNSTLRDNILFGKPFEEAKYCKILEACALNADLEVLPAGDNTEIGEKGINLSGGQKQRVSLARALYSEAELYLFDDPLSAVDAHVGKHIFENVVGPSGLLKNQTRVLVTHGLTYVSQTDLIIVMRNGTISEVGTYEELLKSQGPFSELIATYVANDTSETEDAQDEQPTSIKSDIASGQKIEKSSSEPTSKGKLVMAETVETGKVKRKIYLVYLKESGVFAIFMLILYALSHASNAGANIWLGEWSDDKPNADGTQNIPLRNLRLGIYGLLGLLFGLFLFLGTLALVNGAMQASGVLHAKMLNSILRAPQWFFDTTPIGRILNRFSSDIDVVDMHLPNNLRMTVTFILQLLAGLIVVIIEMPWFSVVAIPVTVLFYFIQIFYLESGRQLRRLDSATKSPIYSCFSECVMGAPTIRAFRLQGFFFSDFTVKIDDNVKCGYLSVIAQRWLTLRMEFLAVILLFSAAMFTVIQKDAFTPGTVGLVVTYTIMITGNLKMLFNASSLLETNIVSVERIIDYSTDIPQEADWTKPHSSPPDTWPDKGAISFQSYETKYREELDTVLKGLTCDVKDGEKVGIVGRTGAGKSSLTLALFRVIESVSGHICIDGVDISTLGLHDLRSRLTIIPQDPILFSGTLRRNLDPFRKHDDADLWNALELSHLKDFISSLPNGLLHELSEGGENLSVGQRQLVCLARALLRRSKILIMDEATASVDLETDDLIQATVRKEFADCTILTIAHRLNTIMDADRIIVLSEGLILECDSPAHLLQDKNSMFFSMAKDAGLI